MKQFLDAREYSELTIFECGKEECVKNKAIQLTKKDYHLFHYVLFGKGTLIINHKEYRLSKGAIFFIPLQTDALYYPDKDDPWIYEWVGFYGSRVPEYIEELGLSANNPIILDKNNNYRHIFNAIVKRYVNNGYSDITSLGALYQLFGEMINDKESQNSLSKTSVTVQLAKDFIKNNYQFDISIIDIAKNSQVTPNYLSAIFQKEEKLTTKRYLTKVRMTKAVELIEQGELKIKDIAMQVGYPNQLHFSNEFKKYYGVSPAHYLKK